MDTVFPQAAAQAKQGGITELNDVAQTERNAPINESSKAVAGPNSEEKYMKNETELPDRDALRRLVYDHAVDSAASSLAVWGIINLGLWFIFRNNITGMFNQIMAPDGAFDFFIYGGAVIGALMLFFAVIGFITKSMITGWLNGLALIGVGLFNALYDFILIGALKPYGYTIKKITSVWVMLGVCQIIWGVRKITAFYELGFRTGAVSAAHKKQAAAWHAGILDEEQNPSDGRLVFTIHQAGGFPFYIDSMEVYLMWLLPDKAYCLEASLDNVFELDRPNHAGIEFTGKIAMTDTQGIFREFELAGEALAAFNVWACPGCYKPVVIDLESKNASTPVAGAESTGQKAGTIPAASTVIPKTMTLDTADEMQVFLENLGYTCTKEQNRWSIRANNSTVTNYAYSQRDFRETVKSIALTHAIAIHDEARPRAQAKSIGT